MLARLIPTATRAAYTNCAGEASGQAACFVKGGTQCFTAVASDLYPGAAVRTCYECDCDVDSGKSGDVDVPVVRCADHYNEGTPHAFPLAMVE
jgi:hypothetical protein